MENYFMGLDGFIWFTGVVEDRNDPSKLGRVKVRCLGYHTNNLEDLPTKDLPWAHVMHPVTDPSMQGFGSSPSFLVEGSWVMGFFRDAREKQQPIIMGSLPGYPQAVPDKTKGFNDPNGKYPSSEITHSGHSTGESDTNRLAQGVVSETHKSLTRRRKNKVPKIPMAGKPGLQNSVEFNKKVEGETWNEPDPKGFVYPPDTENQSDEDFFNNLGSGGSYASATYPFNHVFESESGHIFEIDDTPDGERLNREHMSGTFEEIHPSGRRVVKVVHDDYEIIAGDKKIVVNSTKLGTGLDLTVFGNVRQYVSGDYVLDVGGNFIRRVGKSEIVKIGAANGGNLECEILGNYSTNISKNYIASVGTEEGNYTTTVSGNETRTIGGTQDVFVTKDIFVTSTTASISSFATTDMSIVGANSIDVIAGSGGTSLGSAGAVTTNYESSVTETFGSLATTISGTTAINHTGIATYQYKDAFKERIEKDHFVTKITGFTDHTATVDPARATGTTAVTAI